MTKHMLVKERVQALAPNRNIDNIFHEIDRNKLIRQTEMLINLCVRVVK